MTGPEEGPFDAVAPLLAERVALAARWQEALDAVRKPEGVEDPHEANRIWVAQIRQVNAEYTALDEALFWQIRATQFQADARRYGSPGTSYRSLERLT